MRFQELRPYDLAAHAIQCPQDNRSLILGEYGTDLDAASTELLTRRPPIISKASR
jgi:hypothetical protein